MNENEGANVKDPGFPFRSGMTSAFALGLAERRTHWKMEEYRRLSAFICGLMFGSSLHC